MKRLLLVLGCLSALGCDRSLEEMLRQKSPTQTPQVEEPAPDVNTSVVEQEKPAEPEKPEVELRPEIYASVKRALARLKSKLETGVNRSDFVEALQNLMTEVTLLEGEVKSDEEKDLLRSYQELIWIYRDSREVWDVQLRLVQMEHDARRYSTVHNRVDFVKVQSLGIPLEGLDVRWVDLGLRDIAAKYHLPVNKLQPDSHCNRLAGSPSNVGGGPHYAVEYIPKESMQLIWGVAREKAEQLPQ